MATKTKPRTITVATAVDIIQDIDVEVTESDLEEAGYHHESHCDVSIVEAAEDVLNRHALSDWHDNTHGLSLWQSCQHEPCSLLSLDYRQTP